jgi:hypothetical protein
MRALAAICTILALAGCVSPKGGDGFRLGEDDSMLGEPAGVWVPRFQIYNAQCQSEFPAAIEKCVREKERAYQDGRTDRPDQTNDGVLLGEPVEVWVLRLFGHHAACGYPANATVEFITASENELRAIEKCVRERERVYQAKRGYHVTWTHSYVDTLVSGGYRQPK